MHISTSVRKGSVVVSGHSEFQSIERELRLAATTGLTREDVLAMVKSITDAKSGQLQ